MGQELPDSVALCGALVSDNDFIDCIFSNIPVLPNEIDPLFPICVKSWMGGQATLHVRLFDSVLNIKQQLEVKVGIPASLQRLFLYGQEVADEQVVIDTHIRQRCVVDVVFCTVSGVDEE
ncbi:hypothetical protein BC830DRAFT_1129494 [Chytriomyces sp. MP71]|nr:hypothetical protein BC830DRAFT_1129494 [Chytriomyces sp. MP71]